MTDSIAAADLVKRLKAKGLPPRLCFEAANEITTLRERVAETQMLAFKWMEAHDKLQAGRPYSFPKPADLPQAIARAEAAEARVAELERGLEEMLAYSNPRTNPADKAARKLLQKGQDA